MMPLEENGDGREESDQADSVEAEGAADAGGASEEDYGGIEHDKMAIIK